MKKVLNLISKTTTAVLFGLLLSLSAGQSYAQIAKTGSTTTLKDALKTMLQAEGAKAMKKLTVAVSGQQSSALMDKYGVDTEGSYTVYNGTLADDAVMGSVIIVSQDGKEGPLQVLVAVKPDGKVYDIGFTVFGEDKGKPALNWNFLKQFIGKTAAQSIKIGDDVDGISGATWTSTSISTTVKRALAIHKEFVTQ